MTLDTGTKLGRYEIRSKIGEGGMGEVYLAVDTELDRNVALKILREGLAPNEQRLRRFVQEAKAASALNHPHILTIYEIGTTNTTRFIATEFIDGETVRHRIRNGSQNLNQMLEIIIQTTSALAAAHAAGHPAPCRRPKPYRSFPVIAQRLISWKVRLFVGGAR